MVKKLLAKYRAKRDFSKTAEPSGVTKVKASKGLRFVVQKHAASHLHYDLRLELDGVFKSWAASVPPTVFGTITASMCAPGSRSKTIR